MSKYEYGFEEWSRDTRKFTLRCDRKLTRDEIHFAMSESDLEYEDIEQKIPLDSGAIIFITYHGNEWGNSDFEITEGVEDLADD